MKTDRLYALTLYLINHGQTSATVLARHFEVSVRTIQRDIDSLCCAGIPVIASTGSNGGYSIARNFKMDQHILSKNEFSYMLTALQGLSSVTNDSQMKEVYEKVLSLSDQKNESGIVLDFSVLKEGDEVLLKSLQTAVRNKHVVEFTYTNNKGETRAHRVEPVAVIYRWYAWYLLGYSIEKKDYRMYKLVRMEDAHITEITFSREHLPAEQILEESNRNSGEYGETTRIRLRCRSIAISKMREYLNES